MAWGAAGYVNDQASGSASGPYEKNVCDRTRLHRTAMPAGADRPDTTHDNHFLRNAGSGGRGALPPRPPEIYRIAPIPERHRQKRDAARHPVSGLGSWHGARVASPRRPVLRPGQQPVDLRSHRGTTLRARADAGPEFPFFPAMRSASGMSHSRPKGVFRDVS